MWYVSDIHLDCKSEKLIKQVVDVCLTGSGEIIVAGDVASLHTEVGLSAWRFFADQLRTRYQKIYVVLGNHEHYFGDVTETAGIFRANFPDLRLLDRTIYHEPNYTIGGCTLWSKITTPEKAIFEVNSLINCYYQGQFFTPEIHNRLHREDLNWLNNNTMDIAVTHHPPIPQACKKPKNLMNYYCSNSQRALVGKKIWVSGHTHIRKEIVEKDCRVLLNCAGHKKDYSSFTLRYFDINREGSSS